MIETRGNSTETETSLDRRRDHHARPRLPLEAAWHGDDDDFRRLVEGQRAALHSHCYQILGSLHDADDAVQDTMLRAWRGLSGVRGRSSLRSWLHRIATNVCIDAIHRRRKRPPPIDPLEAAPPGRKWPGERSWSESRPDRALRVGHGAPAPEAHYERTEAVKLAFAIAQHVLPTRQRSVLILRDVLGYSAKEVAVMLGTTVASVNSALQRARRTVDARRLAQGREAGPHSVGDARVLDTGERLANAFDRGDIETILSVVVDDMCEEEVG